MSAIGLAVCDACKVPTQVGDLGLCRICDRDFLEGREALPARPPTCGRCRDTGFLARGSDVVECSCSPRSLPLIEQSRLAGVPERFLGLPAVGLDAGQSLYLWGPTGAGKTRRAAQGLMGWIQETRGDGARFVSTSELQALRKEAIQDDAGDPLDEIKRARYLVLDDLGNERLTEYAWEGLWILLDFRYAHALPTVITAEVPLLGRKGLLGRLEEKCPPGRSLLSIVRRITDLVQPRIYGPGPFPVLQPERSAEGAA